MSSFVFAFPPSGSSSTAVSLPATFAEAIERVAVPVSIGTVLFWCLTFYAQYDYLNRRRKLISDNSDDAIRRKYQDLTGNTHLGLGGNLVITTLLLLTIFFTVNGQLDKTPLGICVFSPVFVLFSIFFLWHAKVDFRDFEREIGKEEEELIWVSERRLPI